MCAIDEEEIGHKQDHHSTRALPCLCDVGRCFWRLAQLDTKFKAAALDHDAYESNLGRSVAVAWVTPTED